jgi:hypothetical protein
MSIEAMKLALEALEYHQEQTRPIHKTQETIITLRQAIAEAEKEAVLQEISDIGQWDTSDMAHRSNGLAIDDDDTQEYKRPWVGMSDVEIAIYSSGFSGIRLAREIEAQLKERNT